MTLAVSMIDFGRIDAKRELIDLRSGSLETFFSVFQAPPRLKIDDFMSGRKTFVFGLKGTGKTALLLYIEKAERERGSETEFVLFKSQFTEEDRKRIQNNSQFYIVDDERGKDQFQQDFEQEWVIFLSQLLIKKLSDTDEYKEVPLVSRLKNFMNGIGLSSVSRSLPLFPSLSKGRIKLNAGTSGVNFAYEGELEFNPTDRTVTVKSVVDILTKYISNIPGMKKNVVIFIDELEISYGNPATHDRDARLIRDLVVVVSRLNDTFRRQKCPIRFVVAIRSEVLRSVASLGKEIHKDVEDLGVQVSWHSPLSYGTHPLLNIIERRIKISEQQNNLAESEDIWLTYFPESVLKDPIKQFILHYSWYRPRDIVRLLNGAQNYVENRTKFDRDDFLNSMKSYSQNSWNEHTEELQASYEKDEIFGTKMILQGIRSSFTFEQFQAECAKKSSMYKAIPQLFKKRTAADILGDLFRIGIVGNIIYNAFGANKSSVRWVFRGDADVDLSSQLIIHRALWQELSVHTNQKELDQY